MCRPPRLTERFGGTSPWTIIAATLIVLTLAACGGRSSGDDGAGGNGTGDDGTGDSNGDATTAEQVTLQASSVRLASSGERAVEVSALLRDANNNVIEGVDVQFSADSGTLQVMQGTTDAAGQATAQLGPGSAENRTIQVTATQGNDQASIEIEVFGTSLAIDGPRSLNPGGSGDYTVTLQDSAGDPIANQTVMVTSAQGSTLEQSNPVTDSLGQARFSVSNVSSADDTITVSALGATASLDIDVSNNVLNFTSPDPGTLVELNSPQTLTVDLDTTSAEEGGQTITFGASRGSLTSPTATTDPDGMASVDIRSGNAGPATITAETSIADSNPNTSLAIEFVATAPKSLELQASPSQLAPTESSTITATVRDADGNLVRDQRIFFNLKDSSNGELDPPSATTDSEGRASAVYTASSTTSGQDGVEITASVDGTSISDTVPLTVGGEALRVSMNTGNTINTNAEDTRYLEPWTVLVTDSSGNPVQNADVELSITPLHYYKGQWVPVDTDGDGEADEWGKAYSSVNEGDLDMAGQWRCISEDRIPVEGLDPEDTRFNGILDDNPGVSGDADGDGVIESTTEDIDGDGLEPENTATVSPGTVTTDETGFADFVVAYPQGNATWTRVRLEATVSVAGSERSETNVFDLRVLADDVRNLDASPPGGIEGPYGEIGDCENPV